MINSRPPWGLHRGGAQSAFTIALVTISDVPATSRIPGALRVLGGGGRGSRRGLLPGSGRQAAGALLLDQVMVTRAMVPSEPHRTGLPTLVCNSPASPHSSVGFFLADAFGANPNLNEQEALYNLGTSSSV